MTPVSCCFLLLVRLSIFLADMDDSLRRFTLQLLSA